MKLNKTLSSAGSTLTDEALDKEEKLKETKRKFKIVKAQLKKEMKDNQALVKENQELRGKLGLEKDVLFAGFDASDSKQISEQEIEEIKAQAEKDAYKKMEKITNDYKERLTLKEAEYQKLSQKQDELHALNTGLKQDVKRLEIEILDLKSMNDRTEQEKIQYKNLLRESEGKFEAQARQLNEALSKIDILELELQQTKHKVMESEYAAFCMTLTQNGSMNAEPQNIQLIMRKNCHGESILEFESPLGHLKVIKASQVLDVIPLAEDQKGFKIQFDGYFKDKSRCVEIFYSNNRFRVMKYLKNFLKSAADAEALKNAQFPASSVKRNLLTDLKSMFIC